MCLEDTFPSLLLTEGKMLFFSSQNLEDTEACRQSSCYSNRDVTPFNVLPQAFTLLMAWLKILREAFCNSLVTVPSFPWDWWQISASWACLATRPGSIHLLIAGKLKSFYPGSGWGTACWESVSSEDTGYLYSVKQLWCSVDLVSLGCSRWDSSNCSTCGSTGLENPNLWGLKADTTKPLVVHEPWSSCAKISEESPTAWLGSAMRGWDLLQLRWELLSSTVSPAWQLLSGDKGFTCVMCSLLLYSHLANTVRILSAFCQVVQDFSGRSFHYMGTGKEADVVGGTATWNNFPRTTALNGELKNKAWLP